MKKEQAIQKMDEMGSQGIPFLFVVDFLMEHCEVIPLSELSEHNIYFEINHSTQSNNATNKNEFSFHKKPISYNEYSKGFNFVHKNLLFGNSYLTNYTAETPIKTNLSLNEIYKFSKARYKILYKEEFVCFSPETFVQFKQGKVYSNPMKGTIDANIKNADKIILNDKKEASEHATITDLIRNDLSTIATKVTVENYRYIETLCTNSGNLLQVSSKISGVLPNNHNQKLGTLFFKLLPAGSISGAPKQKTVDVILEAESYHRGYYTGVFGVFNGHELDSSVMIRFIEKRENKLFYKSGGGITASSICKNEYNELISKVYLTF